MAHISNLKANDTSYSIRATGIPFGECNPTSTSTAFTATVPGIQELTDGVCCMIKNGVVTSESGFTLNVNGLGAKPSYNNMATGNDVTPTDPTRDTTIFNINYAMLFVYSSTIVDGGGWICYRGYDANTNTIGYLLRHNSSTLPASDKFYRYRLLFTSADGTKFVPANTSSSTNGTASRTVNLRPIDPFGEIVYYSSTTAVNAGASPAATVLWDEYVLNLGYSFNRTGAALVLTYPKPVYIKCAPQTDGSAIIDADTPYVQAMPSTNDGKIYIFLGIAYSATNIELIPNHPVYYHDGTGVRIWTGKVIPSIDGLATEAYVDSAISNLPTPMVFQGTIGTSGTSSIVPSSPTEGDTYKIIEGGQSLTFSGVTDPIKVGDTVVYKNSTVGWILIPSGDEPSGTVTSVNMSVPTGLLVSGGPITTSGTLAISMANGYTIPTTAKQDNWDIAYNLIGNKANVADLATVATSGLYNDLQDKPTIPNIDDAKPLVVTITSSTSGDNTTYSLANGTFNQMVAAYNAGRDLICYYHGQIHQLSYSDAPSIFYFTSFQGDEGSYSCFEINGDNDIIKYDGAVPTKTSDLTNDSGFINKAMYYGNCPTAAFFPTKLCTVETFPTYTDNGVTHANTGTIIAVKFSNTDNSGGDAQTLNVNNIGAKSIIYNNTIITTSMRDIPAVGIANTIIYYRYDSSFDEGNGAWEYLGKSIDSDSTYSNASLGQGYGTQTNASATTAITANISSYDLTIGGIVSIKFTYDVPASATLNINSKGAKAIYNRGAAIAAGVIKAGDTATFIYSTYYYLISIDRDETVIVDSSITQNGTNPVQGSAIYNALLGKQNKSIEMYAAYETLLSALTGTSYENPVTLTGTALEQFNDLVNKYTDGSYSFLFLGTPLVTDSETWENIGAMTFHILYGGRSATDSMSSFTINKQGDNYWVENTSRSIQAQLVSGTNIKTINNQSLLGSGNLTASDIGALPSNTHIPNDIKVGSVAGKLYRDDVNGSGNFTVRGNSGCIPNLTAGTFLVSIYAKSATQSYTFRFNFGSSVTYDLSTTNGEINDVRQITIPSNGTFSGLVLNGSVASGTILYVVMYDYLTPVSTVGVAAVTNRYSDLDGTPNIPTVNNGTLTIQRNGTTIGTFTANLSSNTTANINIPILTSVTVSGTGAVTQALDSNKFYKFGSLTSLTLTLNAASEGLAIYGGKFTADSSGCTMTIPSTVTAASSVPTILGGSTYEFNILDNVLLMTEI